MFIKLMIENGHDVVIVDNLLTGKKENISKKARFYNIDIRDKGIDAVFKKEAFDIVSHHAAQIDVRKSVANPSFDADINILGFLNILDNCVKYKVKKVFIQII